MAEIQSELPVVSPVFASGPNAARGVLVSALSASGTMERLRQLAASRDLIRWMPELAALKGVQQPKEHYWDVYEHSLQTVAAVEVVVSSVLPSWHEANLSAYLSQSVDGECSRLALLKLAALLHDIAKPQTKCFEPDGRMRFFGHSLVGAQVARSILVRLGFSDKAQEMVGLMVEHHLRPSQLTSRPELPTERALYRFFRDTAGVGVETLLLNLADHKAMRGPLLSDFAWQEHVDRTRDLITNHLVKQKVVRPVKLVDGDEIMSRFGLKQGPLVGELLSAVREAQARGEVTSKEQALALASQTLSKRGSSPTGGRG